MKDQSGRFRNVLFSLTFATLWKLSFWASAQPGSVDSSFVPDTPPYGSVTTMALQSDGKLVYGAQMVTFPTSIKIGRLLVSGESDMTFTNSFVTNGAVRAMTLDPQARIVLGGAFQVIQDKPLQRIARLDTRGVVDPAFNPAGPNGDIMALGIQSNGQILVGGPFTKLSETSRRGLARLDPDGSLDSGFDPGAGVDTSSSEVIKAIVPLPDGRIAIAGAFTSYNGVTRNRVAVLKPDGSADPGFNPGIGPNAVVDALLVQPDGKFLIGGGFTNVSGKLRRGIARLNSDGSLDATFSPVHGITSSDIVFPPLVWALGLQQNGTVLLGGIFDFVNGQKRQGVARLFADGSLDPDWDPLGVGGVYCLVQAPEGAWYVGGGFNSLQGSSRYGLARLRSTAANTPGRFEFSSAQYRVQEDSGVVMVTIQRTGGSLGAASVACSTEDGTAHSPGDYWGVSTNLSFEDGQTQMTISVPLVDNGRADDLGCCGSYFDVMNGGFIDRNAFGLRLGSPSAGTILGSQQYSLAIITEKDTAFSFVSANYDIAELSGFLDVQVKRIGNKDGTNTITLSTIDGTAVAGQDYAARTADLVFVAGEVTKSLRIPVLENPAHDSNRVFQVVLRAPTGGAGLIEPTAATVTIQSQAGLESSTWPGSVDTSFLPGNGVQCLYGIFTMAVQFDRKMIVGGGFTSIDGWPQYELARLNGDGSLDSSYRPSVVSNVFQIRATTLLPDGRLLAGGPQRWDAGSQGLFLLNAAGTLDSSFDCGTGPAGGYGEVDAVVRQPDGKILVGGDFNEFNGVPAKLVTRLNPDGKPDSDFHSGLEGTRVGAIALQADGRILVGGEFVLTNGSCGIARLLPNGTVDPSFNSAWITWGSITSVGIQQDGRIIIAGQFSVAGGGNYRRVARLLSDGTRDATFMPVIDADTSMFCMAVQPDDKILIGGTFTTVHGLPRNRIARLNADGSLDLVFAVGTGADDSVRALLVQPDRSILVAGDFTHMNGRYRPGIARLLGGDPPLTAPLFPSQPLGRVATEGENVSFEAAVRGFPLPTLQWTFNGQAIPGATTNRLELPNVTTNNAGTYAVVAANSQGTNTSVGAMLQVTRSATLPGRLDLSFYPGTGATIPQINYEASVSALAVDSLGRIVIAGNFSRINGLSCDGLARLLPDGTVDPSFVLRAGLHPRNSHSLSLQPDGKIVLGGLARLNADGTLDMSFDSSGISGALNGEVNATAVQPDGRILIAGRFSISQYGLEWPIARLESNGSLDESFRPVAVSADVRGYALALQPDGKIILGGNFSVIQGVPRNNVARFLADGTLDLTFNPATNFSGTVFGVAVQTDGKIVIAGNLSSMVDGSRAGVVRLLSDGSLDNSFNSGRGADTYIRSLLLQSGDRILLAGPFTAFDNIPRPGLVRLLADGSVDPEFTTGAGPDLEIYTLGIQADGRVVVGGGFTNFDGRPRCCIARLLNSADSAAGALEFTQPAQAVWENGGTNLVLKVHRTQGAHGLVRVNYAVSGEAGKAGTDFRPFYGTLTFEDGQAGELSIPLTVLNNQIAQGDRLLNVWLGSAWGGAVWGSNAATRVLIQEDDLALEFAKTRIYCVENQGAQPVEVRRLGRLDQSVSVDWMTSGGTALPGVDYVATQGTLLFSPGMSNQVFQVSILEDGMPEPDLTAGLYLTNASTDAMLTSNSTAVLTILDNDRPGSLDTSYNAQLCGPDSSQMAVQVAVQKDGRSAVVLDLGLLPEAHHLARFMPGGAIDTSFGSPFESQLDQNVVIRKLVMLADDRMFICGQITSAYVPGWWTTFVLRLLPDGQVDTSFHSAVQDASCLLPLANGQLIVEGGFTEPLDHRLVRLNGDGSIDPTFHASLWASNSLAVVGQIAAAPEGKILLAGLFDTLSGGREYKLVRIDQAGSLDETFTAEILTDYSHDWLGVAINCLIVQPDAKILVGGTFAYANDFGRTNLARFNADGSVDPVFATTFPPGGLWGRNWVTSLALDPDGKIIVGGCFPAIDGVARNGLARLNTDGSLDPQFFSGQEIPDPGINPRQLVSMAREADGGILIGCLEYSVFGLEPRCGLVRINGTRVAAPRWISAIGHPPGGSTRLRFFATPGTTHLVQACTNLKDWITLGAANDLGGGIFGFEDPLSAVLQTRFYRLLSID